MLTFQSETMKKIADLNSTDSENKGDSGNNGNIGNSGTTGGSNNTGNTGTNNSAFPGGSVSRTNSGKQMEMTEKQIMYQNTNPIQVVLLLM